MKLKCCLVIYERKRGRDAESEVKFMAGYGGPNDRVSAAVTNEMGQSY